MNIVRIASSAAIVLFAMTPGCSGQEPPQEDLGKAAAEQKSAGYGYEFMDDAVGNSAAAPGGNQAVQPNGKLAPETIRDVVRATFGGLRACYEAALANDPALAGQISVKFTIHQDGSVSGTQTDSSTIGDAVMVDCVLDHFAGIQYPASNAGDASVIYPVMFSPGDDN
ncbi:MAG: AgmX/PglI C-terminal domain-containing protein [Polyangiaceae bacterium]|nr:AgmX/PglI C-terminal domain-containing protein [Polyangiaceae bacterium]